MLDIIVNKPNFPGSLLFSIILIFSRKGRIHENLIAAEAFSVFGCAKLDNAEPGIFFKMKGKQMRLNKTKKNEIILEIKTKIMKEAKAEYEIIASDFADLFYEKYFTEEEHQALNDPKLEALFVQIQSVYIGTCHIDKGRTVYIDEILFSKSKLASYNFRCNTSISNGICLELGISKEFIKLLKKADELHKKEKRLDQELEKVIMPMTTTKALRKAWPQIDDFCDLEKDNLVNAPAVHVKDLNSVINELKISPAH